jgi:ribonuclease M5
MRSVREVIVVEGRYDKNAVAQAVEATIVTTEGFGVFSDSKKVALLRNLERARGLVILTDSDSAGFLIRGHLKGMLGGENVKHAYIPDVAGRERRKSSPSREGKLGVEGMSREVILEVLERAGATFVDESSRYTTRETVTKADLYTEGLSGGANSSVPRAKLLEKLGLPSRRATNSILEVVNIMMTRDEFLRVARELVIDGKK